MSITDRNIQNVDLHAKVLSTDIVKRAKQRGIDAIVYAPHFTRLPEIRKQAKQYTDEDLLVIPGREIFTGTWENRKHVLGLDLQEPIPDFITLEGAMKELQRQDAAVLVPHPEFFTVGLTAADCRKYSNIIVGVETYNPKHLTVHNKRAQKLAVGLPAPRFGSSYAHLPRTVGEVWTELSSPVSSESELITAIKQEAPRKVRHQTGKRHRWQSVKEFLHLGWENSWKKFDRIIVSGIEDTHPSHQAYTGKFDDVSVY